MAMMGPSSTTMTKKPKATWNGFSLKPRKEMPEGLWVRCPGCEHMLYKSAVQKNLDVCPSCNHHFRIGATARIRYLVDEDTFQPILENMTSADPVSYTHLRAHETVLDLVCRLLLEKKNNTPL